MLVYFHFPNLRFDMFDIRRNYSLSIHNMRKCIWCVFQYNVHRKKSLDISRRLFSLGIMNFRNFKNSQSARFTLKTSAQGAIIGIECRRHGHRG